MDMTITEIAAVDAEARRLEGVRIRKRLLAEFGANRRITNVLGQKRVLVVVLDEIIPEEG